MAKLKKMEVKAYIPRYKYIWLVSVFWVINSIIAGRERRTFHWSPEESAISKYLQALSKASALIKLIQLRQRRGKNKTAAACWKGIREDENKKRICYRDKATNSSEGGSHVLTQAFPWEAKFKAISKVVTQHSLDRLGAGELNWQTLVPAHSLTHSLPYSLTHYLTCPEGFGFSVWSHRGSLKSLRNV